LPKSEPGLLNSETKLNFLIPFRDVLAPRQNAAGHHSVGEFPWRTA
jgi:hypothetical protein